MGLRILIYFTLLILPACGQQGHCISSTSDNIEEIPSYYTGVSKNRPSCISPQLVANNLDDELYLSWVAFDNYPVILKWMDNYWQEILLTKNVLDSVNRHGLVKEVSIVPINKNELLMVLLVCNITECKDCGKTHKSSGRVILTYLYRLNSWKYLENIDISINEDIYEIEYPNIFIGHSKYVYLTCLMKYNINNSVQYYWAIYKYTKETWEIVNARVPILNYNGIKDEKFYMNRISICEYNSKIYAIWSPNPKKILTICVDEEGKYSFIDSGIPEYKNNSRIISSSPSIICTDNIGVNIFWIVEEEIGDILYGMRLNGNKWMPINGDSEIVLRGIKILDNSRLNPVMRNKDDISIYYIDDNNMICEVDVNKIERNRKVLPNKSEAGDMSIVKYRENEIIIAWRDINGSGGDILVIRSNSDDKGNAGEMGEDSIRILEPGRYLCELSKYLERYLDREKTKIEVSAITSAPMQKPIKYTIKLTKNQIRNVLCIIGESVKRRSGWFLINKPLSIDKIDEGGLSKYCIIISIENNKIEIAGEGPFYDININESKLGMALHYREFELNYSKLKEILSSGKKEEVK